MPSSVILRQRALTLTWNGTVNFADREEWQNHTDVMNPTNAALNAMFNSSQNTGGLEVYFVKTLDEEGASRGFNCDYGLALAQPANAVAFAHEVLHQCGLEDIYSSFPDETPLEISGGPDSSRLPKDWGGGCYQKSATQSDLAERLIMNGWSDISENSIDLPSGSIYGLGCTIDPQTGEKTWNLGLRKVGEDSVYNQPVDHL